MFLLGAHEKSSSPKRTKNPRQVDEDEQQQTSERKL